MWDTAQQARVDKQTGARVRCIGSDPRRAHGLAPVLVLADEPAQWPETTGERMVAALRTAAGKQPHSRFVALGTRPADETHWFAKMLAGGADYAQCHAAGPDDPKFHKRTWAKANPSMAHLPDLESAVRTEARQARQDPGLLASFEALRLNLGTEDAAVSTLLDAGLWRVIEGAAEMDGPAGRRGSSRIGGVRAICARRLARPGSRWRRSNFAAWAWVFATAPKISASSAGRVRIAGLCRSRRSCCGPRWPKRARSPTRRATPSWRRAHRAVVDSVLATMQRQRLSLRSPPASVRRLLPGRSGATGGWRDE